MGLVLIAFDCAPCPPFQLITKATAVGGDLDRTLTLISGIKVGEVPHKSHELVRGGVDPGKFDVTGKHQNVGSRKQRCSTKRFLCCLMQKHRFDIFSSAF